MLDPVRHPFIDDFGMLLRKARRGADHDPAAQPLNRIGLRVGQHRQRLGRHRDVPRSPKVSGRQDELADHLRVAERHRLGDISAHRVAHDRSLIDAQCPQQRCGIASQHLCGVWSRRFARLTHTAVVKGDHLVFLCQAGDHLVPHPQIVSQPRDQDQWLPRAIYLIVDLYLACTNLGHRFLPGPSSGSSQAARLPTTRLHTAP